MKLTILGTMSPYSKPNSACPAYLIETDKARILLDCGSGSHRFFDMQNKLEGLNIVISHLHRDHYNDLFNYQYSSFVLHRQNKISKPINIYLPTLPQQIVQDIKQECHAFCCYYPISQHQELEIGDLKINFMKTEHSREVDTYAIKITEGDQVLTYTADMSFSAKDKISEFAKNSNILLCEASLLQNYGFPEINSHLTAKQAGIIAKQANVDKLILTHFWPEEDLENYLREAKSVFGNTIIAKENMIVDLNKKMEFFKNENRYLCR